MPATAKKSAAIVKARLKSKPARRAMPSPSALDMHRWTQVEVMGLSIEQIAALGKTNVLNVQDSIDYIKEWKFRHSTGMLETKLIEVTMAQMDGVSRVFDQGLKAEKVVYVNQKTGKVKKAPDMGMRLKTVEGIRSLVETSLPKGPAVQLNQQFNNGMPGSGFGPRMSFEAILREKREARGLVNAQEAEILQAEMTHAESVADEFKDLGGDDEDEEEDDDAE